MQVFRHVGATRLEARDDRGAAGDAVEVIDCQGHTGLAGNREQMEHAVGRPTAGGDGSDRVLERSLRYDLARSDVLRHQIHHQPAGSFGDLILVWVERGNVICSRRTDPQEFQRHRHRVRGELSTAGAGAGAGAVFDLKQFVLAHLAGGNRADRFENLHQRNVSAFMPAGGDGAAVDSQAGDVDPHQGHDGGGDRLVASRDQDQAVEEMASGHQLDRVGDHLAAHERGFHALGAHRYTIGDGDGVEFHRRATGGADPRLHFFGEPAVIEIAGHGFDPAVPDTDERLGQVLAGEADGVQHRPRRRTVVALC